jgi:polyisoprenyl-teichoic acid--peptidoglycan teichoic acid transferase
VIRRIVAAGASLTAIVAGLGLAALQTPTAVGAPIFEIGRAHADFEPTLSGKKPIFILLLGSDARTGTPVDKGLCDSIHILGINPAAGRATLVGIPRDSYVQLSTDGTNKINSAMPQGGPRAMVDTVEQLAGVHFSYYLLTSFDGFTRLINALGGLQVDAPYSFQGHLGTSFSEGKQTLDGASALEFARTRKTLVHGDFDRSMNQGRLMLAALMQFRKEFERDPAALFRWTGAGLRNVETDVPLDELFTLAFTASEINLKKVTNAVTVGTIGTGPGGISIVNLPSPNPIFQDIAKDGYIVSKDIPAENEPAN